MSYANHSLEFCNNICKYAIHFLEFCNSWGGVELVASRVSILIMICVLRMSMSYTCKSISLVLTVSHALAPCLVHLL